MISSFEVKNEEAMLALGEKIGKELTRGVFFALSGDLGAGKTVFIRGLARGLGIKGRVCSPTFTVMCQYRGRMALNHFDLYRITEDDCIEAGFDDFFFDPDAVNAVEWSERLSEFPENTVKVNIIKTGETERKVEFNDECGILAFLGNEK